MTRDSRAEAPPPTAAAPAHGVGHETLCSLLGPDRSLHLGHELGRHFPDPMLLGVLHGVLQHLVLVLAANDVRTPGRRVDLGALDHLSHYGTPFESPAGPDNVDYHPRQSIREPRQNVTTYAMPASGR